MAHAKNFRETGDRIEALLADLGNGADPATVAKTEELTHLLVEIYGEGLARIVAIVGDEANGSGLLERLAGDELVASLLVLHGLHPIDVETRIQTALDKVRPYLGSHAGGVEFLGVDDEGVVHLRLEGSCQGCPSSTITVKLAIERSIMEAAPEVTRIAVEGVTERPAADRLITLDSLRGETPNGNGATATWVTLDGWASPPPGTLTPTAVAGIDLIVCAAGEDLYAYRNACPACGAAWREGRLEGGLLACPTCGGRYDVRLAGRGRDQRDQYLDPIPLLADANGVRIAMPGVG